jgi:membrane-anchored protein YejM (alkaline phosphatase superfamily)
MAVSTGFDFHTPAAITRMLIVTKEQPMVRKEWLIAMAIVFVALMALVFATCTTRVG